MRNFTKKAIKCAKAAAAAAAFAFCMTKTAEVSQAVSGAVERCIGVVIPSLFAMMIVSGLLVRSGITGAVPRFIGMMSEKLLGMEGFMLPVFTFGMFAGYPVGAKMICTEVQCGRLDKNRAALLCGLCYGAGPAFIFGCISGRLYSSPTAGAVILVSNTAANLILALLLMPKLKRSLRRGIPRRGFSLSADMLTRSVISAGRSMAEIPIQHCNGDILKRMNRWGDTERLEALFAKIREKIKGVTIRTTLITGFPGETEEQFNELAEFVNRVRFDRLGCFAYSREEGTPAYNFPDQVDEETAAHRADIIMQQQMLISAENNEKLLGKELEAVVEGFDKFGECWFGRTPLDAPDIDGKVFFSSESPLEIGDFVKIRITDTLDYDLIGEVISNESSK